MGATCGKLHVIALAHDLPRTHVPLVGPVSQQKYSQDRSFPPYDGSRYIGTLPRWVCELSVLEPPIFSPFGQSLTPPEMSAPLASANVDVAPSLSAPSFEFDLSLSVQVPRNTGFILDPRRNRSLQRAVQLFESVSIETAVVMVRVPPSSGGSVAAAFTPPGSNYPTPASLVGCHESGFGFAAVDSVSFQVSLPRGHFFGRELVGSNVGNPAPLIRVMTEGFPQNTTTSALVTVILTVRGTGRAAAPVSIVLDTT